MYKSVWLCEECYKKACESAGYEIAIMPIYNILRDKCENCSQTGEHFVDIKV